MTNCRQQGHGHLIPNGTEPFKMAGASKIECEVWFIKDHSFAVYSAEGFITLQHHKPERLMGALMSPNVILVELAPKLEVIRVHLDQPGIPLRFYMTSGELKPCY